jgi:hypothetical protein
MTYDKKSFELAEHFIDDEIVTARLGITEHDYRCKRLAEHIQASIEDWIAANPPSTLKECE